MFNILTTNVNCNAATHIATKMFKLKLANNPVKILYHYGCPIKLFTDSQNRYPRGGNTKPSNNPLL